MSACDYEDILDDFGDLDDDSDMKKLIFKKHPVDKTDDQSELEKIIFEKNLVDKTDKQTEDQTSNTSQREFNPYLTNGFSHHYQLGESTFIFRARRSDFKILFHF